MSGLTRRALSDRAVTIKLECQNTYYELYPYVTADTTQLLIVGNPIIEDDSDITFKNDESSMQAGFIDTRKFFFSE